LDKERFEKVDNRARSVFCIVVYISRAK